MFIENTIVSIQPPRGEMIIENPIVSIQPRRGDIGTSDAAPLQFLMNRINEELEAAPLQFLMNRINEELDILPEHARYIAGRITPPGFG